jgi:hypothetical protein
MNAETSTSPSSSSVGQKQRRCHQFAIEGGIGVHVHRMEERITCREPSGRVTEAGSTCAAYPVKEAEERGVTVGEVIPVVKSRKKIGVEPSELMWGGAALSCADSRVFFHHALKFEGYENEEEITTRDG